MATTRIYIVNAKGELAGSAWLVEAASQSQAINHVVRNQYRADVATTRQVADLVTAGYRLEVAGDEPAGEKQS